MTTINPQQQKFIDEYLITGNATQSAINAGYSPKTAQMQGSRLLKREDIKQAIEQAQIEQRERHNLTVDKLLEQLEDARLLAIETGRASAAVAAIMGKARLLGFDKPIETTTNIDVKSGLGWFYGANHSTITEEEADARILELTKKLGIKIDDDTAPCT